MGLDLPTGACGDGYFTIIIIASAAVVYIWGLIT